MEVEIVMQARDVKFVVRKLALNEYHRNSVETLSPMKHFTFAHAHGVAH